MHLYKTCKLRGEREKERIREKTNRSKKLRIIVLEILSVTRIMANAVFLTRTAVWVTF